MNDLIFRLCSTFSGAGDEKNIAELVKTEMQDYSNEVIIDKNYNVICSAGNRNSSRCILIDAHIDQISMVVTSVDDSGFINISPCGGVDCRVLPGATVRIHGKELVTGIVCTTPPHLATKDKDEFEKTENLLIDTGLTSEKLHESISIGDYVSFDAVPQKLIGNRVVAPALDNRAGVAALIRCAQMLKNETLGCQVAFLFSSQEEVRALGAKTAAFALEPTEAISVDVSFAQQPNVAKEKSGELAHGPMIGIAPSLSRNISETLIRLAEKHKIPHQLEVMGGPTGTTSDVITTSKNGVSGGLLSIPLRYMHTPVEIVDMTDVEYTARLLAAYILEGGNKID